MRWTVLVFVAIWIAIHAYMGRRLITSTALKPVHKRFAWVALVLFGSLTPVGQIVLRTGGVPSQLLATVVYLAMGVSSLMIAFLFAFDIARLLQGGVERVLRNRTQKEVLSAQDDPERRKFFGRLGRAALLGGSGGLAGAGYVIATSTPPIREVEIRVPGLPANYEGYHVVQITDVHVGPTIRNGWLDGVVDAVNTLKPDLIAATGDLVDGKVRDFIPDVAPFSRLSARDGVFYVTGNHEYYWEGDTWCRHFESLGMQVLNNRHVVLERGDDRLVVAGVTDRSAGGRLKGHASDPAKALADRPEGVPTLMLAHRPRSVFEVCEHGVEVQISGHTHGGQYFPFSAMIGLFQPFAHGLHTHKGTQVYVSRGTGYWGPPMRAGSTSEITSIKLVKA